MCSLPLSQGTARNCGLVFGTNAIIALGIKVLHSNGEAAHPSPSTCEEPMKEVHPSKEPTESSTNRSEKPESTEGMKGADTQPNLKKTMERLERV